MLSSLFALALVVRQLSTQRSSWFSFAAYQAVCVFGVGVGVAELKGLLPFRSPVAGKNSLQWHPPRLQSLAFTLFFASVTIFCMWLATETPFFWAVVVMLLGLTYLQMVQTVNTWTITVNDEWLECVSRPLPSFRRGLKMRVYTDSNVKVREVREVHRVRGVRQVHRTYRIVLASPGRADVLLMKCDAEDEAYDLAGQIWDLVVREE